MTDASEPTTIPRPTVAQLIDVMAKFPGAHDGRVEVHIREHLGITPTRYYQLLNKAIDTTEAATHDPVTTHRLRRQRDDRTATRTARTN